MSTQMIIRIDKKIRDKFAQLARIEGKNNQSESLALFFISLTGSAFFVGKGR